MTPEEVLANCWVIDDPFHYRLVCRHCEWPKSEHEPSCPFALLSVSQERVRELERLVERIKEWDDGLVKSCQEALVLEGGER